MGKGEEESSHVFHFGLGLGTPWYTAAVPSGTPAVTAHPPDLLSFSSRLGLEGTTFSPASWPHCPAKDIHTKGLCQLLGGPSAEVPEVVQLPR